MHTPLTRTAAAAVGALMMLWLAVPLVAFAATAKVGNSEEAWFLAKKEVLAEPTGEDPTCDLPTGCNVSGTGQRPNPHPEGVMVVAANGGDPDAQTFFNFDTSKLPLGAVITGGTVTLPVAEDPDARNARPEKAKMVACPATGFIPDGTDGGSYKDRPTFDEPCVDVKQAKADPLTYTVDLERMGKAWASGKTMMNGITVMVDPEVKPPAPDETWRVAFNTRRRAEQKTQEEKDKPAEQRTGFKYLPITSTIEYKVQKSILPPVTGIGGGSTSSGGGGGSPSVFPPADTGGDTGGGSFSSGDSGVASADTGSTDFGSSGAPAAAGPAPAAPADSGAPPVDAPVAAGEEAPVAAGPTQPVAAVGPSMAVWVLPVIALAMAAAMAWSLLQPVQLVGEREGAVSRLMRTRRLNATNPS